jgi:hypothetical protein
MWNTAAVVEWVIALVYTFWVISFVIDFLPSARPDHHDMHGGRVPNMDEVGLANGESAHRHTGAFARDSEAHYPSGTTASGGVGWANGHHKESNPRNFA